MMKKLRALTALILIGALLSAGCAATTGNAEEVYRGEIRSVSRSAGRSKSFGRRRRSTSNPHSISTALRLDARRAVFFVYQMIYKRKTSLIRINRIKEAISFCQKGSA